MKFDRRTFLSSAAVTATWSAIGGSAALAATGAPEKKSLKIGFIPITCATPLIMAKSLGYYAKYGLDVELVKLPGWAALRDKAVSGELDAFHMLSPMPLALSLGLGSAKVPIKLASIENINGQAITLSKSLIGKVKKVKDLKGLRLGVPFDYSMHNLLLRYYLAGAGINPDRDVQIRIVPPPDMVAKLSVGDLDGFLGPDPTNQRAVFEGAGYIHLLTSEIWQDHPCCAFAAQADFIDKNPNTFKLVNKAIIDAAHHAHGPEHRLEIAKSIAPKEYLNQPEPVLEAILTGRFDDGKGGHMVVPRRIDFSPFPWHTYSYWIVTQLERWGYIKSPVDYEAVSKDVFLTDTARELAREVGFAVPNNNFETVKLMYDTFDPRQAAEYVAKQKRTLA
ncbi:MAG: CmpA/NrtA family ABC transporter substrate-binding protein [Vulcanimicrobiaceae bacterium]